MYLCVFTDDNNSQLLQDIDESVDEEAVLQEQTQNFVGEQMLRGPQESLPSEAVPNMVSE